MRSIEYTTQFKRDLKLAKRQNKNLGLLEKVMLCIQKKEKLPEKYRDHALSGNWRSHRELHLEPDWLLIYRIPPKENIVIFVRVGSHASLFKQ